MISSVEFVKVSFKIDDVIISTFSEFRLLSSVAEGSVVILESVRNVGVFKGPEICSNLKSFFDKFSENNLTRNVSGALVVPY